VPFENLTVTGVEACTACCARVSDAAALEGVNVPLNKMPLAWPGLNPGCAPNMASNCFKISSLSAINFSSFGSGIVSQSLTHPVRCPVQPLVPPEVKTKADRHLLAMSTRLPCLSLTRQVAFVVARRRKPCAYASAKQQIGKRTERLRHNGAKSSRRSVRARSPWQ